MKNIKYIAAAFLISGMLSAQNIDINAMPKPAATPVINIAKPKTFQLKNGLTVLVVENHKLPRVTANLIINIPNVYEGDIAGVGGIMAAQLGKGTAKLSKDEFNKKVDFLGANISFKEDGVYVNSLSKYFPQVLELMAQAITYPNFNDEEIKSDKLRTIEGLKSQEKSVDAISNRVANALLFGKNTPYGEFKTEESVNKIQLSDVQQYYKSNFIPDNAYLAIVGDVKFSEVEKLVKKQFKNWKKSGKKHIAAPLANNLSQTEINFVDVPNAVQSVISISNISSLQMKSPLFFAGKLANEILGGGGEARLFMNLREKNGFTYGAYSRLSTDKYLRFFTASAGVRNEVTDKAVREFMNELNAISTVKQEELDLVKAKFKGNFIMSLEKPATIANFALNQRIYELPENFYTDYLKSIDNVTLSDISKAVKENILPNQSRIFIAGKASEIADSVEKLGYPVKYFDAYANPTQKPATKKIDANVTVESIAQKFISATGSKAAIEKVKYLTTNASGTVQGMALELSTIKGKKGEFLMEMKMMGNTVQKIVFNGKDGYIVAQGNKIPMPEEAKTEMKAEAGLFPEANFTKDKVELKGIETINGEDAYALKQGSTTYYYSVKSGLKLGELKLQKANGQEMSIPTYYSDYKEVQGLKLPFKITQNINGMEMIFNVNSYEINKATEATFK